MEERRRWPRRELDGAWATLVAPSDVRIVDISQSGVLIASSRRVHPGARGRLRLSLGGEPFVADVEVRRIAEAPGPGAGFLIGAEFVALDPVHRQRIERFITQ